MQYLFCAWLIKNNNIIMFSMFIHTLSHMTQTPDSGIMMFVSIYPIFFIHSPAYRCLSWNYVLPIIKNIAINKEYSYFFEVLILFPLDVYEVIRLLLSVLDGSSLFYYYYFLRSLPTVFCKTHTGWIFSTVSRTAFSPTSWIYLLLFDNSRSIMYEMPHCFFFPN